MAWYDKFRHNHISILLCAIIVVGEGVVRAYPPYILGLLWPSSPLILAP